VVRWIVSVRWVIKSGDREKSLFYRINLNELFFIVKISIQF
jgi:hypothetical protein